MELKILYKCIFRFNQKKNILFLLDNEYYINIVDINIIVLYIFVKL